MCSALVNSMPVTVNGYACCSLDFGSGGGSGMSYGNPEIFLQVTQWLIAFLTCWRPAGIQYLRRRAVSVEFTPARNWQMSAANDQFCERILFLVAGVETWQIQRLVNCESSNHNKWDLCCLGKGTVGEPVLCKGKIWIACCWFLCSRSLVDSSWSTPFLHYPILV